MAWLFGALVAASWPATCLSMRGSGAASVAVDVVQTHASAVCPTPSILTQWAAKGLTLAKEKSNGRAYVTCMAGTAKEQKVSCLRAECGGDAWCFVDNGCGGWLYTCQKIQNFDLQCPSEEAILPIEAWALVGLTSFSVAPGLGDWFSKSDVYAEVKVQPSARTYRSKVFWNTNQGNLDMHLFVPQAESSLAITLQDKDTVTFDDPIGRCEVQLPADRSQPSDFEKTLKAIAWFGGTAVDSGSEVGTLKGYIAVGEASVLRAHEALIMRGVQPIFGDPEQGNRYGAVQISNDQVEHELAYARSGSVIPEGLHGIWWMDQRGKHLPIPSDPEYKQECESAADELLVTFGEGQWDPQSLCLLNVWVWGGSPRGHWVFMNNGGAESADWAGSFAGKLKGHFCFRDDTFQEIDLKLLVKAGDVLEAGIGLNLPEPVDGFIELPRAIISLNMIRKPWGWDRETVVGPDVRKLRDFLKGDLFAFLESANRVCRYPVFQIVDGDGKRTEHYDAYLAWANTDFPDCKESSFDCPINNGNGTSLAARLVG